MKFLKSFLNLDSLIGTLIVFMFMGSFPLVFSINLLLPLKNTLMDFQVTDINYQSLRVPEDVLADTNVVLVNTSGLSKMELAELLNNLNSYKPKVIGLDKILKVGNHDSSDVALAEALAGIKNLVMKNELIYNPRTKNYDSLEYSDEFFRGSAKCGYGNIMLSGNARFETVRDFSPSVKIGDSTIYSFVATVVQAFNPSAFDFLNRRNNKTELIDFRGKFDKYYYTESAAILKNDIDKNLFRNKVLLLSDAEPLNENFIFEKKYYTPLNVNSTGRAVPDMYDIEIQANIISMILQKNYFNTISSVLAMLIAFVFCYINLCLYIIIEDKLEKWYELISLVMFVIESLLLLLIGYYAYHNYMFELKLSFTLFALILSAPIFEAYTKSIKPLSLEFINKIFKR